MKPLHWTSGRRLVVTVLLGAIAGLSLEAGTGQAAGVNTENEGGAAPRPADALLHMAPATP